MKLEHVSFLQPKERPAYPVVSVTSGNLTDPQVERKGKMVQCATM